MENINKYKTVLIDLWGTIFIEEKDTVHKLNKDRAKILYSYSKYNDVDYWYNELIKNIKQFKIKEKKGISIKPAQRIEMITKNKKNIENILLEFDNLFYNKYIPNINYKLINNLNNCQSLILISNTGLVRKECIEKILKKYNIYDKFDKLYFSEDYSVCKPNVEFFEKPIKELNLKTKEVIMIGDSKEMDYEPCKKLGIKSIIKDWSDNGI